eukprot:SAG31_NODE_29269_length_398_cov_0.685619_1_plen_43_part_01
MRLAALWKTARAIRSSDLNSLLFVGGRRATADDDSTLVQTVAY